MKTNTTIHILSAVTHTNSTSKLSRITGTQIALGAIVFDRVDGIFFENIIIGEKTFRPFYDFKTGRVELSPSDKKQKTITVTEFKEI
jgi:hypothetical protein